MSKGNRPVVVSKNTTVTTPQITYLTGEKVWFTVKGVTVPGVVAAVTLTGQVQADGTLCTYLVQGDTLTNIWPAYLPAGPYKNILASALTDRP